LESFDEQSIVPVFDFFSPKKGSKDNFSFDELIEQSRHRDGYTREFAVSKLCELNNPTALPDLLLRANDWVPQVRLISAKAIRSLLKSENAPTFFDQLPRVVALLGCNRDQHGSLVNDITQFLKSPSVSDHLINALDSHEPKVRRIAFRMCSEAQTLPVNELIERSLSDKDVLIKQEGLTKIIGLPKIQQIFFAKRFFDSRISDVRVLATRTLLRVQDNAEGIQFAQIACADINGSVRAIAIYYLKNKFTNYREIVAARLIEILRQPTNSTALTVGALRGLIDLNYGDSCYLIKTFASSEAVPKVQSAALYALNKLNFDGTIALSEAALYSTSSSVKKIGAKNLVSLGIRYDADWLIDFVSQNPTFDQLRTASSLAIFSDKWERLIFTLSFFSNEKFSKENESAIFSWLSDFNRSFYSPTKTQISRIRALLNNLKKSQLSSHLSYIKEIIEQHP
jgi:HEAT repeat protein